MRSSPSSAGAGFFCALRRDAIVPLALWHKDASVSNTCKISDIAGFSRSSILEDVKRPWKAVAIGSAVLGAIGIGVLARRKPAPPKRVALIGDSYAVGLGPELDKLIPDFRAEGHVGTTTWQWANHNDECGTCGDWLTAFKPNIVLVSLGVNDGTAPNLGHYQTIVRGLQGIGARVIWIEPPAAVSAPAARRAIASLGVQTVPATTTPLASDGLHPKSYGPWSQEIAGVVRNA